MDINKVITSWEKLSDEKWKTAQALIKSKRYADALFFCHLSLEALIKAYVVLETKKPAPYIHNLAELFDLAKIDTNDEQFNQLKEITTFNIKGRYSDYKYDFYKKATKLYTEKYFEITKNLRIWTKKNIQKKK